MADQLFPIKKEEGNDLFPVKLLEENIQEEDLFPTVRETEQSDQLPSSSRTRSGSLQKPNRKNSAFKPVKSVRRSTVVDPSHEKDHSSGNAIDIIVIRNENENGPWTSTEWKVNFSWSIFKSSESAGVGDVITLEINGTQLNSYMTLKDKGRSTFKHGLLHPNMDEVAQILQSSNTSEMNIVRFQHLRSHDGMLRHVECRLFVWDANASVIIADLDGTLTISDVEGHIRTLRLGQYDYLHKGACEFLHKLKEVGCKIFYLTARPIAWAGASRVHLENAKQDGFTLPYGPLITNTRSLTGALVTEVIHKTPHLFKANVINLISTCMTTAGRTSTYPIFTAGFGNRPTDAQAYTSGGISTDLIFLIDPTSKIRVYGDARPRFDSYNDPKVLLWLLPKLKRKMPLEYVDRIDTYTAREVVLSDEVDEERIATLRAQQEKIDAHIHNGNDRHSTTF